MATKPKDKKADSGGPELTQAVVPPVGERQHRATYSKNKREGGFNIRITGPHANRFANKAGIPVATKAGGEKKEDTGDLLFTGVDDETGQPFAVYAKIRKPKEEQDEIPF